MSGVLHKVNSLGSECHRGSRNVAQYPRNTFKRIYALIPLPGETVEFFAESSRTIVQVALRELLADAFVKGPASAYIL